MVTEILLVLFLFLFITDIGKKFFNSPIIEGNTNKECSDALDLSKQNAGNLTYIKDEIDKIKRIEAKMQKLNTSVMINEKNLQQVTENQQKQAQEVGDGIKI
tara:strand:+ start:5042 stop:5347 length:306 start_codon:yes stop_codon:yes gene_type:complete